MRSNKATLALALVLPIVVGVVNAPSIQAQSADAPKPRFEVAAIRPIKERGSFLEVNPDKLLLSSNQYRVRMATVPSLIMNAYNVRSDQFTGLPDWADDSDKYEIDAKAEGEGIPSPDRVRLMLQALLADRFHLRLHHETKNILVYELTIAKSGLKIKVTPERTTGSAVDRWSIVPFLIGTFLDYPVVDKTELTGFIPGDKPKWDEVKLTEEMREARPANLGPGISFHGLAPSIFHEVEAAFGLTLKKVSSPTDFLVIEHVERPSEN